MNIANHFVILAASALVSLLPRQASAQEPVRKDCLAAITATSGLKFDDQAHRLWYARYWTGKCSSQLGFGCFSGSPNWNDTVTSIVRQASAAKRQDARKKACRLGQLIGFEWAKENNIRCIHTSNLKPLSKPLKESGDILKRLDKIERHARAKLGCRS